MFISGDSGQVHGNDIKKVLTFICFVLCFIYYYCWIPYTLYYILYTSFKFTISLKRIEFSCFIQQYLNPSCTCTRVQCLSNTYELITSLQYFNLLQNSVSRCYRVNLAVDPIIDDKSINEILFNSLLFSISSAYT